MKMKNRIKKTLSNQKGFIQSLIPSVFRSKRGSSKVTNSEETAVLCDGADEQVPGPSSSVSDHLESSRPGQSSPPEKRRVLVEECGNSTTETFLSSLTSSDDEYPENNQTFQNDPNSVIVSDVLETDTQGDKLIQTYPDMSEKTFLTEKIVLESNEDRLLMPPPTKPPLLPSKYRRRRFPGGQATQSCPALPYGSLTGKLMTSRERRRLRRSVSAHSAPKNYPTIKYYLGVSVKAAIQELKESLPQERNVQENSPSTSSNSYTETFQDDSTFEDEEINCSVISAHESFPHKDNSPAEDSLVAQALMEISKTKLSPFHSQDETDPDCNPTIEPAASKLPGFACLQASLKPREGSSQINFPRHQVFMDASEEKSQEPHESQHEPIMIQGQRYSSLYLHLQNSGRSKRQPLIQHLQSIGDEPSDNDSVSCNSKSVAPDPIGLALAQEFQKTFDMPLDNERLNYMVTEPQGTDRDIWMQAVISVMVAILGSKRSNPVLTPFHHFDQLMCSAKWILGGAVHVDLEKATYSCLVELERDFFPPHAFFGVEDKLLLSQYLRDIQDQNGPLRVFCSPTFVFPPPEWKSLTLQLIKMAYPQNTKAKAVFRRLYGVTEVL